MQRDSDRRMESDRLVRLEELKGFQVAEGDRDIRGWEVKTPDGKQIGKVEELIVDTAKRRVRYMEVKVDRKALGIDDDRHILVPIGTARIKDDGNDVLIERLTVLELAGAPPYRRGPITREYEASLREYYGATAVDASSDSYRDDLYDDAGVTHRTAPADTVSARDAVPRIGENEVTVPLVGDQEVVVRRAGSDDEIVIKRSEQKIDRKDEPRRDA